MTTIPYACSVISRLDSLAPDLRSGENCPSKTTFSPQNSAVIPSFQAVARRNAERIHQEPNPTMAFDS
ncbi:hypothetical protein SLA2020_312750 [Shorea laevis]